jgi:hypothetical protein
MGFERDEIYHKATDKEHGYVIERYPGDVPVTDAWFIFSFRKDRYSIIVKAHRTHGSKETTYYLSKPDIIPQIMLWGGETKSFIEESLLTIGEGIVALKRPQLKSVGSFLRMKKLRQII